MLGKTVLVSGGTTDLFFAKNFLSTYSFDTVVCADSGLEAAYDLHLPVKYFMGDFDSVNQEILEEYRQGRVEESHRAEWVEYPREKDFVDTQLVLEWILEQGAEEIVVLGGTGGRMDHFLANVHLLMLPLHQGVPACLVDAGNRIRLTDGHMMISREQMWGKYISLLPLTSQAEGVTLRGFYYSLEDYTLEVGFPRAISNELSPESDQGEIFLKKGILIVIESAD